MAEHSNDTIVHLCVKDKIKAITLCLQMYTEGVCNEQETTKLAEDVLPPLPGWRTSTPSKDKGSELRKGKGSSHRG